MTSLERILVRAPNAVGDAVLATPVLRAVRATWPGAEICVEGRPVLADLLRGLPTFDRFLPDPGRGARALAERTRRLRAHRFDVALLLPDSVRTGLAPFLAGIPRRVGYARDPLRRLLLSEPIAPPRDGRRRRPIPMTDRYLRVAHQLGCEERGDALELVVQPDAAERLEKELARLGVGPSEPLLAVTPGAGFGPSKRWPPEHFAAACDGIARELGLRPVLAPGPGERGIAERVAAAARETVHVLGDPGPGLGELKALVERARLVLTNDTGPRHVAVALDRPVVVAMGPTDPRHTACHLGRQRVLREEVACSPCQRPTCPLDHRCLVRLRPERAVAAARELLGGPSRDLS